MILFFSIELEYLKLRWKHDIFQYISKCYYDVWNAVICYILYS